MKYIKYQFNATPYKEVKTGKTIMTPFGTEQDEHVWVRSENEVWQDNEIEYNEKDLAYLKADKNIRNIEVIEKGGE